MTYDREHPQLRPAGRAIVIDDAGRVLLFKTVIGPGQPEVWITPGGALEPGETAEAAARRELWEETGIRHDGPAPCAWTRRHVWKWNERWVDTRETFFVFRVRGEHPVVATRLDPGEADTLREHRWFSLAELRAALAAGVELAPRRMAELLEPILRGELPAAPVDAGV
ncbi:MAG TPA: NUDIX domain-containing protein [Planctomycetota bacterium]|nr:NUDIX domain-containing protein [Planctomycetota bacterium]